MIKKTVRMVGVNYLQGNSVFLPYAAGTLVAYAKNNALVDLYYSFEDIIFIREDIEQLMERISNSDIFGFSNYIWNHEYNKVLARKIKQKNPDCIIIFGGHSVNPDGSLLDECSFIDYLIHGEGEETFTKLLLALAQETAVESIPNISLRKNGMCINTPFMQLSGTDYISPYLSGCFDKIMDDHPDLDFQAVIETSRGCPYRCSYCDWGNLNSKIKVFPLDKIFAELNWLSDKKIKFFGSADANFGLLERDEEIVNRMTELHKKTGYLKNFQTSYAKNSNERIFRMTKELNEYGMNKGVTISYQTLSSIAEKNVRRENIPTKSFTELMNKYNREGIATYTELIIGLPGETLDSFITGIDTLLDAGQHNSIYFHNCEWLPCSEMGKKEYTEEYEIQTSRIPLNQPHREQIKNDEVQEFSSIVTSMYSMSSDDWIKMNLYSAIIQCFHFGGLMQVFALYLHQDKGLKYSDFYKLLMDFVLSPKNMVSFNVFSKIKSKLEDVVTGCGELTIEDKRFGNVTWSFDEYSFLLLATDIKSLFKEMASFLHSFEMEENIFESLYTYQQNIIKLPFNCEVSFSTEYDVKDYFESSLKSEHKALKKSRTSYIIKNNTEYTAWSDYAKYVVWYGKKDSKNFFTDEVCVCLQDAII